MVLHVLSNIFQRKKKLVSPSGLKLIRGGECTLILVHLGDEWHAYIDECIEQVRLFNSEMPIIIVASKAAIKKSRASYGDEHLLFWINSRNIAQTKRHRSFLKNTKLDPKWKGGFWKYTTERFFILDEVITSLDLKNCFHIENDNLIYVKLGEILPVFLKNEIKIAAPFDNDERCIPSFMYFKDAGCTKILSEHLSDVSNSGEIINDMKALALFRKKNPEILATLPIVPENFECSYTTQMGQVAADPKIYSYLASEFSSVFDAAALGQFLAGIENNPEQRGFLNEGCIFNPGDLTILEERDSFERKVFYIQYKEKKYRINNLHIHSKQLRAFRK